MSKPLFVLVQPQVGNLIRELRQLTQLTQGQLAQTLGVAYETINRWENQRMQPSPLALRQIRALLVELTRSSSPEVRSRSSQLLTHHFSEG